MPCATVMIEYFKDNSLVWFRCQSSEGDGGDVARMGTAVKGLNGTTAHDDKRAELRVIVVMRVTAVCVQVYLVFMVLPLIVVGVRCSQLVPLISN